MLQTEQEDNKMNMVIVTIFFFCYNKERKEACFMDSKKKKMYIILGSVVGAIVLLIMIVAIFFLLQNRSLSYSQMEERLLEAGQRYYALHKELLPKEDGETATVDASTLVQEELIKSFVDMTKDENTSCNGSATVTNTRGEYYYTSYISCGEAYETELLTAHIKDQLGVLTQDQSGLYELNNEYVYRGERPQNILHFAGVDWRIIKVDKDGYIMLLLQDDKIDRSVWDDRYNVDTNGNEGINDYEKSRIRTTVNNFYNDYFTDNEKKLIASHSICIGMRNSDTTSLDGSTECSKLLENEAIGLIPAYDVMNASLDSTCKPESKTCQNYNYLGRIFSQGWWTVTANSRISSFVYIINRGVPDPVNAFTFGDVRPVIYLQQNVQYKSGIGTLEDPYLIK